MSGATKEVAANFVKALENPNGLLSYADAKDRIRQLFVSCDAFDDNAWSTSIVRAGFYTVITQEFFSELLGEMQRRRLTDLPSIEVCSGRGVISHHLQRAGIPIVAVDKKSDPNTQGRNMAKNFDPVDHRQALEKYQPKVVVGCWIPDYVEIGEDILNFPSVDYFLDIGEEAGLATWMPRDYQHKDFTLMHLHNITRYAIGMTDYYYRDHGAIKFSEHTVARFWKRKGAPMSIDHRFD